MMTFLFSVVSLIQHFSQVIILVLLAAYAFILFKSKLNPKIVRTSAIGILAAGVILYMFAYIKEGYNEGIVVVFFRSLLSAVKLFIYNADYCEILAAQQVPLFMEAFILVFYAAILTSLSAIIMLFGKRAMTALVLLFRRKKYDHIFLGVNPRSEMIAKGIHDQEIAFIEFPGETDEEEVSVSRVLRSMTDGSQEGGLLSTRHVSLLRAKHRLSQSPDKEGVLSQIGLGRLSKLIGPDTAFYLLSEDSERNLKELLAIISDDSLSNNTVHTCVRREGLARSYQAVLGKTGAHFIYPSSLSVVEMMKTPECHPASVMDIDKTDATASGAFNALVVGFGETGQAAAKFIYEFASACQKDGSPLPVHIYVNDASLDRLRGQFLFSSPAMDHDGIMVFQNYGLDSDEFWKGLQHHIDELNYVEISMHDDAVNLELACTIFSYAEKMRKGGLDNFRIVVRKRHTPEYERRLVKRLNEKAGHEVIVCYGEYEKIFTPEMIVSKSRSGINASATSLADKLAENYRAITSSEGIQADASDSETFHQKRTRRRETHQFISRANHIPTKKMFAGDATPSGEVLENLARMEHLRYVRYLEAHGYTFSPEDDDVLKTSHQICPWSSLTEQERQYHRDMVLASL